MGSRAHAGDKNKRNTFGKPILPQVSNNLLEQSSNQYHACPMKAVLLMFIVVPLISLIMGVLFHYLGIAVGLLENLIAQGTLVPSGLIVIFCVLIVFALFLFYPFLMGMIIGGMTGGFGKKGFCGNSLVAGIAGAFNGAVAYFGHVLITLFVSGAVQPMTEMRVLFEGVTVEGYSIAIEGFPNWLIYLLMAIEITMQVVGGFRSARYKIKTLRFCEKHHVWYNGWNYEQVAYFPISIAESLADALANNDPEQIEFTDQVNEDTLPSLSIQARGCPADPNCDIEFLAVMNWEETKMSANGKEKKKFRADQWFDIVIPSEFGKAIVEKLQIDMGLVHGK